MYWSRTGSFIDLLAWGVLMALTTAGGWLLVVSLFRLRAYERLLAGLTLGLLLFGLAADVLALALPLTPALWGAALLTAGAGALSAWRARTRLPWGDFAQWPILAAFGLTLLVFIGVNRGLALFDDYANLPLTALLTDGYAPPPFYLNPDLVLDYHYGLHLLAAGLGRVGGFFPWSALDFYKALSISLALALGVLFYRRWMGKSARVWWLGLFTLFAGGSRWLFLLLPETWLRSLGEHVTLIGSGMQTAPGLYQALLGPWRVEGDGPFPFSFAFISGVSRPLSFSMGSSSAMPLAGLFLLMLLARRRWTWASGVVYGLGLASLALFSDHIFALAWGGLALATAWQVGQTWRARRPPRAPRRSLRAAPPGEALPGDALPGDVQPGEALPGDVLPGDVLPGAALPGEALPGAGGAWLAPLLPGLLLAPLMSGVLSGLLKRLSGGASLGDSGVGLPGLALRWPPAVFSSHLGALELSDPAQALMALIEIGPLLLLAPFALWAGWRARRRGRLLWAGLAVMSVVSFLAPMLLRFVERERDITRLSGAALTFWMILGLPYAWAAFRRGGRGLRLGLAASFVVVVFGGLALFPAQLIAAAQTQPSYFVQEVDARMARRFWDRLPRDAWIIDPRYASRPAALFARTTGPAYRNAYVMLPEYRALLQAFDPHQMAAAGYRYVYLDRDAWQALSLPQQDAFKSGCVKLLAQEKDPIGDFRRLYDITDCKK